MESSTNHTDDKDILPPKEAPTCTTATMPSSTTTRDATINGERAGAEADADGEVEVEGEGEEVPVSSRGEPKGPPGACLFVASLAPDTTESVLHIYFLQFGPILKVKLLKDKAARPYAFVQFMNIEDADACLSASQSHLLEGRRLRVEKAKVNRTLFVAKLHRLMTNNELRAVAEEFGPVENVTIIKNHQTNKSKGCGFIKYVFREDAMDALAGIKQRNKKWVTEWATSSNDPDMLGVDKNSIFVGGLNATLITRELLEERFSKYGKVESLTLINPMKPAATTTTATNTTATDSGDNAATTATTAVEGKVENDVASVEAPATNEDSSTTVIEQSEAGAESEDKVGATTDNSNSNNTNAEDNEDDDDTSDDSEDSLHAKALSKRTAFAFLRFTESGASASAIENENSCTWLERRIRVQYCETPEMKYRKKFNKYITILSRYGQAPYFYGNNGAMTGTGTTDVSSTPATATASTTPANVTTSAIAPASSTTATSASSYNQLNGAGYGSEYSGAALTTATNGAYYGGMYYGWYFNPDANAWYYAQPSSEDDYGYAAQQQQDYHQSYQSDSSHQHQGHQYYSHHHNSHHHANGYEYHRGHQHSAALTASTTSAHEHHNHNSGQHHSNSHYHGRKSGRGTYYTERRNTSNGHQVDTRTASNTSVPTRQPVTDATDTATSSDSAKTAVVVQKSAPGSYAAVAAKASAIPAPTPGTQRNPQQQQQAQKRVPSQSTTHTHTPTAAVAVAAKAN